MIGNHGGTQREKDIISSMKSILVLLQISWIGGEEPRYKSVRNYHFELYYNGETRQNKLYEVHGYVQRLSRRLYLSCFIDQKTSS